MPLPILFTDLDGTLLDETYQPGRAAGALARLRGAGVRVVFCSSKTLSEQRQLATRLGVDEAFVVENGGGVALPPGFPRAEPLVQAEERGFGIPYSEVRRMLHQAAREAGVRVRGYGDMTVEEVAELTGLPREDAVRARDRRWSETFLLDSQRPGQALLERLRDLGLVTSVGTRFWTTHGKHDKGTGVQAVLARLDEPAISFAVGDAANDLPMLAAVDHPLLVERMQGGWQPAEVPGLERVEGRGPVGWVEAARRVLDLLDQRGGREK